MKKLILGSLLSVALFANNAFGQTEKGNLLIGGSIANIRIGVVDAGGSSISLTPNAGYFVADGIAIGASLPIGFSSSSYDGFGGKYTTSSTNFGLGAFGRYYFSTGNPLSFFGGLSLGVNAYSYKSKFTPTSGSSFTDSDSDTDFYSVLSVGAVYFLNETIGVEGILSTSDITENGFALNFGVGFQIYFNRGK
jgi:hypothetical protein